MPECVISNTSPLFYLHQIDHLELLRRLYGQIIIPEAVIRELEPADCRANLCLM
jgi:predicted nucleic acid-binding protein